MKNKANKAILVYILYIIGGLMFLHAGKSLFSIALGTMIAPMIGIGMNSLRTLNSTPPASGKNNGYDIFINAFVMFCSLMAMVINLSVAKVFSSSLCLWTGFLVVTFVFFSNFNTMALFINSGKRNGIINLLFFLNTNSKVKITVQALLALLCAVSLSQLPWRISQTTGAGLEFVGGLIILTISFILFFEFSEKNNSKTGKV
ncbi:MAG: hypothetical protein LWY06_05375 [Firmicutes bacterium]|nr:hypothetical protein [Bacillota bacterium]